MYPLHGYNDFTDNSFAKLFRFDSLGPGYGIKKAVLGEVGSQGTPDV
ncbi:MAG: hypothetical protein H6Q52_2530 [Deltaproteobacteria bacterium]|nr:hypothetical protein [Deltaproteobacteria bacterium]